MECMSQAAELDCGSETVQRTRKTIANSMNSSSRFSAGVRPIAVLAMCLGLLSVGCQSGAFEATSLPAEFTPPSVVDVQTLNLSRLGSSTFRSDQVRPGDTLEMRVVTGAEKGDAKTWPLVVQDDGNVEVPLVGTVSLAGLDVDTARQTIIAASIDRGIYRKPTVTLDVDKRRTNYVTVVGAVKEPGGYELPASGSDLLAALVEAGGLNEDADSVVEIRRAGRSANPAIPQNGTPVPDSVIAQVGYDGSSAAAAQPAAFIPGHTFMIDLVAATEQPVPSGFTLGDGDVVTVRRRPPRYVQVIGLVRKPDRIRIPPGQNPRVLDAIAMAGGVRESIADKVLIVRKVPGRMEPVTIEASISEAKRSGTGNPLLADGDVVSVEETPITFAVSAMKSLIRVGVNSTAF